MFNNQLDSFVTNKNLPPFWCNAIPNQVAVIEPPFRGHKFFMSKYYSIPDEQFIGKTFGYITVLREVDKMYRHPTRMVESICICGKISIRPLHNLLQGKTKSCGCKKSEICSKINKTHGLTKSRLYRVYRSMKARCYNKLNPAYKRYGGRGIKICDYWYANFINFYTWARSNGYKDRLTIDRIDNNGNYEPSNCRWATPLIQSKNRRNTIFLTYNGVTKIASEWCDEIKMRRGSFYARLDNGWTIEEIITIPKFKRRVKCR